MGRKVNLNRQGSNLRNEEVKPMSSCVEPETIPPWLFGLFYWNNNILSISLSGKYPAVKGIPNKMYLELGSL